MRKVLFSTSLLCLVSPAVQAADIDTLNSLSQSQFKDFSEDMGAAVNYKAVSPAEPLGDYRFRYRPGGHHHNTGQQRCLLRRLRRLRR